MSSNELTHENLKNFQKQVESNATTYVKMIQCNIIKGEGSIMIDSSGKKYIDCLAGAGTLAFGHNHPKIISSIKKYLDEGGLLHGLDLSTPAKINFSKKLISCLPKEMQDEVKIHFCGPAGTDATEAAIKLFRTATKRNPIISFHGAYHGMTMGAISLTGNLAIKKEIGVSMPDVHFFPFPYEFRNPYGNSNGKIIETSLSHIKSTLIDPNSGILKPAAIIVEAIQGEGGCIPAPNKWLKGLKNICEELDIPLVLDEIQSGFGRTGKMFAFEHADIIPDAVLLSKAVGGGLPLSLLVYNKKFDIWNTGAHTGTFRGNQLAMVAGAESLNMLLEGNIIQEVNHKSSFMMKRLNSMKDKYPIIGDARGKGLMLGIEIIKPNENDSSGNPKANGELANAIKHECFKRSLILENGGREGCVLRFLPALTISIDLLDESLSILEDVLKEINYYE